MCKYTCSLLHSLISPGFPLFVSFVFNCSVQFRLSALYTGHFHISILLWTLSYVSYSHQKQIYQHTATNCTSQMLTDGPSHSLSVPLFPDLTLLQSKCAYSDYSGILENSFQQGTRNRNEQQSRIRQVFYVSLPNKRASSWPAYVYLIFNKGGIDFSNRQSRRLLSLINMQYHEVGWTLQNQN